MDMNTSADRLHQWVVIHIHVRRIQLENITHTIPRILLQIHIIQRQLGNM